MVAQIHNIFEVLVLTCTTITPGCQRESKLICESADFADPYNRSPQDEGCTGLCSSGIPALHHAQFFAKSSKMMHVSSSISSFHALKY